MPLFCPDYAYTYPRFNREHPCPSREGHAWMRVSLGTMACNRCGSSVGTVNPRLPRPNARICRIARVSGEPAKDYCVLLRRGEA